MASALKIGIAGLGTVGASLARLLLERHARLAEICGRPLDIVAVSARDAARDRGFDQTGMAFFDDPVEMASSAEIDVFVELIGGEEDPAARRDPDGRLRRGDRVQRVGVGDGHQTVGRRGEQAVLGAARGVGGGDAAKEDAGVQAGFRERDRFIVVARGRIQIHREGFGEKRVFVAVAVVDLLKELGLWSDGVAS